MSHESSQVEILSRLSLKSLENPTHLSTEQYLERQVRLWCLESLQLFSSKTQKLSPSSQIYMTLTLTSLSGKILSRQQVLMFSNIPVLLYSEPLMRSILETLCLLPR